MFQIWTNELVGILKNIYSINKNIAEVNIDIDKKKITFKTVGDGSSGEFTTDIRIVDYCGKERTMMFYIKPIKINKKGSYLNIDIDNDNKNMIIYDYDTRISFDIMYLR